MKKVRNLVLLVFSVLILSTGMAGASHLQGDRFDKPLRYPTINSNKMQDHETYILTRGWWSPYSHGGHNTSWMRAWFHEYNTTVYKDTRRTVSSNSVSVEIEHDGTIYESPVMPKDKFKGRVTITEHYTWIDNIGYVYTYQLNYMGTDFYLTTVY